MANPYYSEFPERQAMQTEPRPKLRRPAPKTGLSEGSWAMPTTPGKPRRIHRPLGRKVKTAPQGDC